MKALRKICNLLSTLLVIIVVALAIALVGVRAVGLTPYTVLSGSMEPTYHVGSLIYVKEVDHKDIQIGDPITFIVNEDLLVATHRVVDIEVLETKQETVTDPETGKQSVVTVPLDEPVYYYQTKGDANDVVDGAPVHYKNIVGKPVFSLPFLGYLSAWLQTRQGLIMGGAIAIVLLILTFLPDVLRAVDKADEKKKQEEENGKAPKAE